MTPTCKKVGVKIVSVLGEYYYQVIGNRVLHESDIPKNNLANQFRGLVAPMKEDVNFAFRIWFEALIRIINVTIFVETIVIIYERGII